MSPMDRRASLAALGEALTGDGDVLITIHGTNDADLADDADPDRPRWWQRGSEFLGRTAEALGAAGAPPMRVAPFHWSGANSDEDRLDAARALAGLMRILDKRGRPYHLLAHSHGGNVALAAIAHLAAKRRRPKLLRSVVSLGTPFLHRKLRLIETMNAAYLVLGAVFALVIGLLVLLAYVPTLTSTSGDEVLALVLIIGALFVFPYLALSQALPVLRERGRLVRLAKRMDLGNKWLAAISHRDEAIGLLRRAHAFSARFITPRSMRRSLWRLSGVVAAVAAVVSIYYFGGNESLRGAADPFEQIGVAYGFLIFILPVFFGYLLLAWGLAASGPQYFISWLANRSILSGLRAGMFGEDSRYVITGADAAPQSFKIRELRLERDDLGGLTAEEAREAASAFYDEVIEMQAGRIVVVADELWKRLNRALYHNAYFRDAEVVDALAAHIAGRAAASLRPEPGSATSARARDAVPA